MTGPISEEGVLKKLLQQMNSQIPSKRQRLSELLQMPDPHYTGRDGCEYAFSVDELRLIRGALDEIGMDDVKLPIVLMADASQEHSVWRVEGVIECALVAHMLEKRIEEPKDKIFLYAAHLAVLRRKMPTTTICMFIP